MAKLKTLKKQPAAGDMQAKLKLPDGFVLHDGGDNPHDPELRVQCLIRTAHSARPALSPIAKSKMHEWPWGEHAGDYGEVVASRVARADEV